MVTQLHETLDKLFPIVAIDKAGFLLVMLAIMAYSEFRLSKMLSNR